jgi:hypothetical protein
VGRQLQADAGAAAHVCANIGWKQCVAVQFLGGEGGVAFREMNRFGLV